MHNLINQSLEDWSVSYTGPKFHAILCDPPYGLEFMGREWDSFSNNTNSALGGQSPANQKEKTPFKTRGKPINGWCKKDREAIYNFEENAKRWGEALLPHLYPGAIVLMFGGTRMWHRLACGMEDAGFVMWDTLMWLYGTGFPKAQNIGVMIDKIRRGVPQGVSDPESPNHGKWASGCSEDNPDGRSFGAGLSEWGGEYTQRQSINEWSGHKTAALKPAWEPILAFKVPTKESYAELAQNYGSGCLNIDACRVELNGDYKSKPNGRPSLTGLGDNYDPKVANQPDTVGRYPSNLLLDGVVAANIGDVKRFFYVAKASTAERNAGLGGFEADTVDDGREKAADNPYQRGKTERRNIHPTVKPITLATYLAKLLLPPDTVKPRRILVPFAGVMSEAIGCKLAGWDEIVAIEQDVNYCDIGRARFEFWETKMKEIHSSDPRAILKTCGNKDKAKQDLKDDSTFENFFGMFEEE